MFTSVRLILRRRIGKNCDVLVEGISDLLRHVEIEAQAGPEDAPGLKVTIGVDPESVCPQQKDELAAPVPAGNNTVDDYSGRIRRFNEDCFLGRVRHCQSPDEIIAGIYLP